MKLWDKGSNKGYSLIEFTIAAGLFAITVGGLGSVISKTMKIENDIRQKTAAVELRDVILGQLQDDQFVAELIINSPHATNESSFNCFRETLEGTPTSCKDQGTEINLQQRNQDGSFSDITRGAGNNHVGVAYNGTICTGFIDANAEVPANPSLENNGLAIVPTGTSKRAQRSPCPLRPKISWQPLCDNNAPPGPSGEGCQLPAIQFNVSIEHYDPAVTGGKNSTKLAISLIKDPFPPPPRLPAAGPPAAPFPVAAPPVPNCGINFNHVGINAKANTTGQQSIVNLSNANPENVGDWYWYDQVTGQVSANNDIGVIARFIERVNVPNSPNVFFAHPPFGGPNPVAQGTIGNLSGTSKAIIAQMIVRDAAQNVQRLRAANVSFQSDLSVQDRLEETFCDTSVSGATYIEQLSCNGPVIYNSTFDGPVTFGPNLSAGPDCAILNTSFNDGFTGGTDHIVIDGSPNISGNIDAHRVFYRNSNINNATINVVGMMEKEAVIIDSTVTNTRIVGEPGRVPINATRYQHSAIISNTSFQGEFETIFNLHIHQSNNVTASFTKNESVEIRESEVTGNFNGGNILRTGESTINGNLINVDFMYLEHETVINGDIKGNGFLHTWGNVQINGTVSSSITIVPH